MGVAASGSVGRDLRAPGELVPYVPRMVLQRLAAAPATRVETLPGSLLFADISGFTKLSERLARMGHEGAERIADAIGTSFAALLEVAYANGGGLLKFGGDALLLAFEGDDHAARACRSAVGMRRALRRAGRIEAPGARVTLRMSIGVHTGTLHLFLAGRSHREPIVAGPAATAALRMEQAAGPGEIVVSAATAADLPGRLLGPATGPGRLLRAAPPGPDAAPGHDPFAAGDALAAEALPVAVRAHLQAGGLAPEHRLVTLAFVRFAGTDALIARQGPDEAAAVLDALVTTVQTAAERHEIAFLGSDVDMDGGKLLLAAGAPRAVGDDDARMLLALREIADSAPPLALQIGVNRGRAFTGDIGPAYRRTYTAMGDAVNVAARLMGKAGPGEIYATADVLERSSTRFATTDLPPLEMKGKARPIRAWALGAPVRRERATAGAGALVGRARELGLLREALAAAREGSGRLVELAGEPGVGKTRLVEALRGAAAGLPVLRATCEAHSAGAPYAPWRELLLDLLGVHFDSPPEAVRGGLEEAVRAHDPGLAPRLPLLAAPLGLELPDTPETAQLSSAFRAARVHEAVVDLLRACLPGPVVLEFEQAHHMDAASGELLGALLEALPGLPWLVVTTRREGAGGFVAPVGPQVTAVPVEPLAPADALALAERMTEDAPLPPHVVAAGGGARGRQPAVPGRPARGRRVGRRGAPRHDRVRGHGADRPPRPARPRRSCAAPPSSARPSTRARSPPCSTARRPPPTSSSAAWATCSPTTATAGCASASACCATRPTPGCRSACAAGCTRSPAPGMEAEQGDAGDALARTSCSPATTPARGRTPARAPSSPAGAARTPTPSRCTAARSPPPAARAIAGRDLAAVWIALGDALARTRRARAGAGRLPPRAPAAGRRPGRRGRRAAPPDRAGRPLRPRAAGGPLRAARPAPAGGARGRRARRGARAPARRARDRAHAPGPLRRRHPPLRPGDRGGRGGRRRRARGARLLRPGLGAARRGPRRRGPPLGARARHLRGEPATSTARPPCSTTSAPTRSTPAAGPRPSRSTAARATSARRRATSSTPRSPTATSARCSCCRAA